MYLTESSVSSIHWDAGVIFDYSNRRVILVANKDDMLRTIDFDTGNVKNDNPSVLLEGIQNFTVEEQIFAIEAAIRLRPDGLNRVANQIFKDKERSLSLKLRAAMALKTCGDASGKQLIMNSISKTTPESDRAYAVEHLVDFLGKDAIHYLREAMKGPATEAWWPAIMGFVRLGKESVPTLIEMIQEEDQSPDYRGGAAHALHDIGSKDAIPALLKAVETADDYTANAAANAAVKIADGTLSEEFIKILEKGSTQDGRIASYFCDYPNEKAVPALLKALRRHSNDSFEASTIVEALNKITGKNKVIQAWRKESLKIK